MQLQSQVSETVKTTFSRQPKLQKEKKKVFWIHYLKTLRPMGLNEEADWPVVFESPSLLCHFSSPPFPTSPFSSGNSIV